MGKVIMSSSYFQAQVNDLLPCNKYRKSQLIHGLIESFGLLSYVDVIAPNFGVNMDDFCKFHSREFIETIIDERFDCVMPFDQDEQKWVELADMRRIYARDNDIVVPDNFLSRQDLYQTFLNRTDRSDALKSNKDRTDTIRNEVLNQKKIAFNLQGDCPIFSFLPMYCRVAAGATLTLSDHINKTNEERVIAINWDGGRHHGNKNTANGFCYFNDIVLLILKLRQKGFNNISYVDFDLHHGDGVEKAFRYASKIQTISLHLHEVGFFPGTGSLDDVKLGKNIVNIPLLHGANDSDILNIVEEIVNPLVQNHNPEVIVIQCGGDGLMGDTYNEWQLSITGLTRSILNIVKKNPETPIVLLGGGGYNPQLMSRFYTYLTWNIINENDPASAPDVGFKPPPQRFHQPQNNFEPTELISSSQLLIPDHSFIDLYSDEYYQFWIYESLDSPRRKTLRNLNKNSNIQKLKEYYGVLVDD